MGTNMISKEEKDRLKAIIADTVTLLCKNGLNAKFKAQFSVEGLIGITLDHEDLMLVSIKEIVENPNPPPPPELPGSSSDSADSSGDDQRIDGSGRKRKRKRKKHKANDGETPAKSQRTGQDDMDDSDYETRTDIDNPDTPSATPAKRNLFSDSNQNTPSASNMDNNSNMESNDSFFTLQDIKQDHSDDDLIEIIKEEPGVSPRGNQPHIVSIQSLPSATGGSQHQHLGSVTQQHMSAMNPNMSSPSGQMPPGLQMAPGQYEDLMQQVELIPGSGVYIKKATFNQLQFIDKGSKLVRKLVREIFPDVHLLASSSCMGKGETSAGLDRHKVEVIKGFVSSQTGLSPNLIVHCVNQVCKEARNKLRHHTSRQDTPPNSEHQSFHGSEVNNSTQDSSDDTKNTILLPLFMASSSNAEPEEVKISVDKTGKTYHNL